MSGGVRVDKWLWVCRFFKTRNLAKQNIDGGKVKVNNVRAKPSRDLQVGDLVQLRQGWDEKTVRVLILSEQRKGAAAAQTLYEETEESIAERERNASIRKAGGKSMLISDRRPTKKERRQIHQFKEKI